MLTQALFAFALSAHVVPANVAEAEDLELVSSFTVSVARGSSYYDHTLRALTTLNPIVLRYEVTSACPRAPAVGINVWRDATRQWERAQGQGNGKYTHSGAKVDALRFEFEHASTRRVTCKFLVYRDKQQPLPDPSDLKLVGAIEHAGGFAQRLQLRLDQPLFAKQLKIVAPRHCPTLEVLEAGTYTEGVFDLADAVDAEPGMYAVNEGAGARIGGIGVSLNSQAGEACTIPVYVEVGED